MKTTTIGRIGAIVTGAAMLGTAVASALAGAVTVDATLTKGFFYDDNMNPKVQMVVGDKAQASDGAVAGQIAAMIGNMAFKSTSANAGGGAQTVASWQVPCTSLGCTGGTGTATGEVTLSWEAIGLIGEVQQREMNCDIYDDTGDWMEMTDLDDGGDGGNFCDDSEVFGPEDTVGTTLVGSCETGVGANIAILKTGEFANEICTICYNFCDIALGCEPHLMSEWVNLSCDLMTLGYDCEDQELKLLVDDDAIVYNVFTDDILTEDILDDGDPAALVGQSYLGKIILGQHEYYVENVDDNSITIVCGATGKATTSAPMEYIAPAEGSDCDAADSGETYSLKLVGAQTIEEKGVVDVTLEVTKPDGTTEQVTSGISGTPVVGDLKVKLQRGTAASNVITGEQSFSADLLVWYVPSEYTFEDDEEYTEEGVKDDEGIWELNFNGGDAADVTIGGLEALEENEELLTDLDMPDDLEENEQFDDCYDGAVTDYNDTPVIRFLEFALQQEDIYTELPEGDMIQLPFNDGKYLLSDLKFGYLGLMNENFLADNLVDETVLDFNIDAISFEDSTGDDLTLYRKVTVDFVDEWGTSLDDVRLDEGPFETDDENMVIINDVVYRIDNVVYDDDDNTQVFMEYSIKDGTDWTEYEIEDEDTAGDAFTFDTNITNAAPYNNSYIESALAGEFLNFSAVGAPTPGWIENTGPDTVATWIIRNLDSTNEGEWEIWVDKDENGNMSMAQTLTGALVWMDTEFENKVFFLANDSVIVVWGDDDTGAEDLVAIQVSEDNETQIGETYVFVDACLYDDNDCEDIAQGEEDGKLVSLSGAWIDITGTEIEEPEDSDETDDVLTEVVVTIPEDEMRPTVFFGLESSTNASSIEITEGDVGTVVDIGGLDVTVEEFGVTGSCGAPVAGGETLVTCASKEVTCATTPYTTKTPVAIGYKLVVVEGAQDASKNLVLIGGPSVNSLTKDLTTATELCAGAQVKLSGNKLLVAGCEAADTASAAEALKTKLAELLAA